MYDVVSNKDESVKLFKSSFLERFTYIHPATPLVVFLPVVTYFLYLAHTKHIWHTNLGFFFAGIVLWSLVEYGMHRFLFHWPFVIKSSIGKRIHFLMHGVHHNYPRDSRRLVMPLPVSIPLAFFFYGLYYLIFAPNHDAVFAGMVLGYIWYDSTHYAVHHFQMKSAIGRWIKTNHLSHHYADHDKSFGVSSPIWDYVFRTYRKTANESVASKQEAA